MVSETTSCNLLDPPHETPSLPSLLPLTFNDSKDVLISNDLDDIHHYMNSMALRSPVKLLEKAKAVLDGGSEFLKAKFASFGAPDNKGEAASIGNPQERRPALGRKRARFSLLPESSQPTTSLEPNFDIDQLHNPEEYFEAFEKLENARKEVQRQKGGNMAGMEEVNLSMNARGRRPGISGKRVSYIHHQYSVHPEDDFLSSQETSQHGIHRLPKDISQQQTAVSSVESQETELVGSVYKSENDTDEIFDELLSSNIENLDGGEALSFLQDRLQMKPIDLHNLCLPEFHDISKTDDVSLEERLPKERYTLSDIRNLLGGLRGETPAKLKQISDSPIQPIASPTPPKNPFSSLSLLGKHISQSSPAIDPFSSQNMDLFPATSPSVEILSGESDQVSRGKKLLISGKLDSLTKDTVATNAVVKDPENAPRRDLIDSADNLVKDNPPSELLAQVDVRGKGSSGDSNGSSNGNDRTAIDENVRGDNPKSGVQMCEQIALEDNSEHVLQESVSYVQPDVNMEGLTNADVQLHGLHDIDSNTDDMQQKASSSKLLDSNVGLSETESLNEDRSLLGQTNCLLTEDHASGIPSKIQESSPDQQNEEHPMAPRKEGSKAARKGGLRKALTRRQSLAEAGTVWKLGVRRSSRVKHKPLAYWKGERLLYGRVHNSLPTVIGLKYMSPTKGDKEPTLRVKSYVSDQYKELVELAALH